MQLYFVFVVLEKPFEMEHLEVVWWAPQKSRDEWPVQIIMKLNNTLVQGLV